MDYLGRPLLACVFLALLLLQWRFPLRRQHFSMLHRLVRNLVLSIPGFAVVRLAMLPIPLAVAVWAQDQHIGLLNWVALPGWVAGGIGPITWSRSSGDFITCITPISIWM
jgi:hypothetical protein